MKLTLVIWLLYCCALSYAQSDNPETLPTKIYELKVKTIAPSSYRLPFESIKILDNRFDTSKIGFLFTKAVFAYAQRPFRKVTLKYNVQQGIENFYNEYYKLNYTNPTNTLLIVIKKLWISDVSSRATEQTQGVGRRKVMQYVYAKFDYYAGAENGYIPLKRIDTTFQLYTTQKGDTYDPKDETFLPFFCFSLENMVEKINYDDYFNFLANKKRYTLEEINSRSTVKKIPILNEPVKKGVFLTFEEFKNNTPSVTNFSKSKIAKKKMYELIDGNKNVIVNYFAYCDGQNLFKSIPLELLLSFNTMQDNPVIRRVGNSFEYYELLGNRMSGRWDRTITGDIFPLIIGLNSYPGK